MKLIRPITVNDTTLTASNILENDHAAYSASTVYAKGDRVITPSNHKIYESITGSRSTVSLTIAAPCVVTWPAHGLAAGTPISFTTTGALPTGLTAGTVYYVLSPVTDTFNLAATPGGAAIATSGTQSGTHTATASTNYNRDPVTDTKTPAVWLLVSATNRWRMFDTSNTSQSSMADAIDTTVKSPDRTDAVALLNVSAASARIVVTDATDGIVYDKTKSLVSDSGIENWHSYFFEPIVRKSDITFLDLPPYSNADVRVVLADTGKTVLCGTCVLGQQRDIGGAEYGASVGIQDYSIKQRDAFGNFSLLERAFSKRARFTLRLPAAFVDQLQALLASYRAIPIVYIGSEKYGSTILFGFYKDFSVDIVMNSQSLCSIELEGLT